MGISAQKVIMLGLINLITLFAFQSSLCIAPSAEALLGLPDYPDSQPVSLSAPLKFPTTYPSHLPD